MCQQQFEAEVMAELYESESKEPESENEHDHTDPWRERNGEKHLPA